MMAPSPEVVASFSRSKSLTLAKYIIVVVLKELQEHIGSCKVVVDERL